MIALIQQEVVVRNHWLSEQEFTDLLAVSQATPGPIGINTATYTGFTAMTNAGFSTMDSVLGAVLSSFAVILVPILLTLCISRLLGQYNDSPFVKGLLVIMRIVVIGLIASAAISLLTIDNFGSPKDSMAQFVISIVVCLSVFYLSIRPNRRPSPIIVLMVSGFVGVIVYSLLNI